MLVSLHSTQANPVPVAGAIDAEGRQWAMLLPAGTIRTVDSQGPFHVADAETVIVTSFEHATTGSLPVDINHAIDLEGAKGRPSPAAGWITRMEARADGIWGLIEWTANAARSIRDKEYRFLSPVLAHTERKEVLAILRASLTNNPNLTMTALNSAQKDVPMDHEAVMAALRTSLGLAADADGAAVVAAVNATKSLNSADPTQFVPIGMFQQTVAELHKLRSGVSLHQAETIVNQAVQSGQILPYMKEWAVGLCQVSTDEFNKFLSGAGKPITQFIKSLQMPSGLDSRGPRSEPVLSDVAQKLGHTAEDMKKYGEGVSQ